MQIHDEQFESQLDRRSARLSQINNKINKLQKRMSWSTDKRDRATETRKKILVGAAMLKLVDYKELRSVMDHYLDRADDRALFDLLPRPEKKNDDQ